MLQPVLAVVYFRGLTQKAGLTNSELINLSWETEFIAPEQLIRVCSINSECGECGERINSSLIEL